LKFGTVLAIVLVFGLAVAAMASGRDHYQRGVTAFNSLLANEKRAGLRAEWLAVMKHFERSLAAEPKGEQAPKCMFFLGRSYEELARRSFAKADRKRALALFDSMLAAYPKHGWSDDALFRKGMIWLEQARDPVQAEGVFKGVLAIYPKGDMAPRATEMLARMAGKSVAPAAQKAPEPAAPEPSRAEPKAEAKAAPKAPAESRLLGIRHWSSNDYTRVVMDMSEDVRYERALLETSSNGGKQLRIALQRTDIAADVMPDRSIDDGILSQIHVAADPDGGALVTFDLMRMDHYRVFTLPEPYRVVLDIYGGPGKEKPLAKAQDAAASAPQDEAGQDVAHVQAALAELQARQLAEQRKAESGKKVATALPPQAPPAHTPAPAKAPDKSAAKGGAAGKKPEIAVTPAQKKHTASLVEQLGLKVRTIMIDAGHGGKDPGAVANGLREKDINLRMAKILGQELRQQGFEVHYTRTTDKFIPLEERTAMANAKNADLFISLHCNAHKDTSVKGFEVYYLNLATDAQAVRVAARENGVSAKKISDMQFILSDLMLNSKINESRQMAAMVEKEALRAMRPKYPLSSHGANGAFFYVLTGARMPSVLVEIGYLTNAAEAARINSEAYLVTMAKGLTSGIVAYKNKLERFALNSSGNS
jgi:N-acetylmuramoyl-L-alanine amidase